MIFWTSNLGLILSAGSFCILSILGNIECFLVVKPLVSITRRYYALIKIYLPVKLISPLGLLSNFKIFLLLKKNNLFSGTSPSLKREVEAEFGKSIGTKLISV